jgi:hypothetical protein
MFGDGFSHVTWIGEHTTIHRASLWEYAMNLIRACDAARIEVEELSVQWQDGVLRYRVLGRAARSLKPVGPDSRRPSA